MQTRVCLRKTLDPVEIRTAVCRPFPVAHRRSKAQYANAGNPTGHSAPLGLNAVALERLLPMPGERLRALRVKALQPGMDRADLAGFAGGTASV